MANGLWIGCVQDGFGRVLSSGATIEVRDSLTGTLTQLYADRSGTKTKGNPYLTTEDGIIKFYCAAGRVDITASRLGQQFTLPDEIVLDDWQEVTAVCGGSWWGYTTNETSVEPGPLSISGESYGGELLVLLAKVTSTGSPLTVLIDGNPMREISPPASEFRAFVADAAEGVEPITYEITSVDSVVYASLYAVTGVQPAANQAESASVGVAFPLDGEFDWVANSACEHAFALVVLEAGAAYDGPTGMSNLNTIGSPDGYTVYRSYDFTSPSTFNVIALDIETPLAGFGVILRTELPLPRYTITAVYQDTPRTGLGDLGYGGSAYGYMYGGGLISPGIVAEYTTLEYVVVELISDEDGSYPITRFGIRFADDVSPNFISTVTVPGFGVLNVVDAAFDGFQFVWEFSTPEGGPGEIPVQALPMIAAYDAGGGDAMLFSIPVVFDDVNPPA